VRPVELMFIHSEPSPWFITRNLPLACPMMTSLAVLMYSTGRDVPPRSLM